MSQHIVLVDDNSDDEMLTVRALRKNNVNAELVVLHDGAEALDYFFSTGKFQGRDTYDCPALILLDLKLPKVSGLEVLEKLRTSDTSCLVPVVVLTTSNEEQDIVTAYRLGANSYIRKPVDFNEFTEAVRKVAEYWLSLNFPVPDRENS